jgi:ribulose-5-phosphate 4-epimerase/fuculose-1-phosphate aldolase
LQVHAFAPAPGADGIAESITNHFNLVVSEDRYKFLLNPSGRNFSRVRASELLLLDARDDSSAKGPDAPEPTAWYRRRQVRDALTDVRSGEGEIPVR